MMTGDFVTHDTLIVLEVTLELGGNFGGCAEDDEYIITFGLIIDGVCKAAFAPFINLFDFTAVSSDDRAELLDYGSIFLFGKIRHDDIKTFVLIHLFFTSLWSYGPAVQSKSGVGIIL